MPYSLLKTPKTRTTHGILIILVYVSLISPQLQRLAFFTKNTKTTTLQQLLEIH